MTVEALNANQYVKPIVWQMKWIHLSCSELVMLCCNSYLDSICCSHYRFLKFGLHIVDQSWSEIMLKWYFDWMNSFDQQWSRICIGFLRTQVLALLLSMPKTAAAYKSHQHVHILNGSFWEILFPKHQSGKKSKSWICKDNTLELMINPLLLFIDCYFGCLFDAHDVDMSSQPFIYNTIFSPSFSFEGWLWITSRRFDFCHGLKHQ